MHDFSCWNPEDMNFEGMRETTEFCKENLKKRWDYMRSNGAATEGFRL
jgi:hypothetical protein